jgi:hypothetical protein
MLMKASTFTALLAWLLLAILPGLAETTGNSLSPFIRYDTEAGQLDTSIVTMRNDRGQEIDLVSAVHVASPSYYTTLNKRFKDYDAVLYELVIPDEMAGQRLPSQLETGSGVSGIQSMIAQSMGLTTQMAKVDYSPINFVHADLTRTGLAQKMAERQENLMSYMMKVLSASDSTSSAQLGVTDQELAQLDLMAIMSGRTSAKDKKTLKKLLGSTLASSGGLLSVLGDSALIAERNKAALKVAQKETQSGKRRMAIFYGAAHMPDLKKRLSEEGWKTTRTDWVKAWD